MIVEIFNKVSSTLFRDSFNQYSSRNAFMQLDTVKKCLLLSLLLVVQSNTHNFSKFSAISSGMVLILEVRSESSPKKNS